MCVGAASQRKGAQSQKGSPSLPFPVPVSACLGSHVVGFPNDVLTAAGVATGTLAGGKVVAGLIQFLDVGGASVLAAAQVAGAATSDKVVVALFVDLFNRHLANVLAAAGVAEAATALQILVALFIELFLGLALATARFLLAAGSLRARLLPSIRLLALDVQAAAIVTEGALPPLEIAADLVGHIPQAILIETRVVFTVGEAAIISVLAASAVAEVKALSTGGHTGRRGDEIALAVLKLAVVTETTAAVVVAESAADFAGGVGVGHGW